MLIKTPANKMLWNLFETITIRNGFAKFLNKGVLPETEELIITNTIRKQDYTYLEGNGSFIHHNTCAFNWAENTDVKASFLLMDIPYIMYPDKYDIDNLSWVGDQFQYGNQRGFLNMQDMLHHVARFAYKVSEQTMTGFIWCSKAQSHALRLELEQFGFTVQDIVVERRNITTQSIQQPNGVGVTNCLENVLFIKRGDHQSWVQYKIKNQPAFDYYVDECVDDPNYTFSSSHLRNLFGQVKFPTQGNWALNPFSKPYHLTDNWMEMFVKKGSVVVEAFAGYCSTMRGAIKKHCTVHFIEKDIKQVEAFEVSKEKALKYFNKEINGKMVNNLVYVKPREAKDKGKKTAVPQPPTDSTIRQQSDDEIELAKKLSLQQYQTDLVHVVGESSKQHLEDQQQIEDEEDEELKQLELKMAERRKALLLKKKLKPPKRNRASSDEDTPVVTKKTKDVAETVETIESDSDDDGIRLPLKRPEPVKVSNPIEPIESDSDDDGIRLPLKRPEPVKQIPEESGDEMDNGSSKTRSHHSNESKHEDPLQFTPTGDDSDDSDSEVENPHSKKADRVENDDESVHSKVSTNMNEASDQETSEEESEVEPTEQENEQVTVHYQIIYRINV
jgi:hypothetical protein